MILTVHVTADHIAQGKPNQCRYCPVALALLEVFPRTDVQVAPTVFWVAPPAELTEMFRIEMPDEVTVLIRRIDAAKSSVQPFDFEITVPEALVPYLNPSLGITQ